MDKMRYDECAGQDEARPALAGGDPPAEVYCRRW